MSLQFPNASRIYDSVRRCVTFWGHDSTFEIAFHVDEDVLRRFSPHEGRDEAASLRAFDVNRHQIERAASGVYARRHQSSHRLSTSDF
ncbi:DUF1488 domain-containing protein [Aquabacter sp. CN5-332]|uniref:DUF1488 domain-containing protein n=1 Tax=Aquabacter sp. CN5-332 TaxID=3156608 RepID=UPI0032B4CAC2